MLQLPLRTALCFLLLAIPTVGQVVFVDVNVASGGAANGTSWADAFPGLGEGLSSVQAGEQLWVATGAYKPFVGGGDLRLATFVLPDDVAVYGGFNGTETQLEQRDFVANPTILSGDIGKLNDSVDNVYHVLTAASVSATLDGFTVRDAFGDLTTGGHNRGGGLSSFESDLEVNNCRFVDNVATSHGGAVISSFDTIAFTDCSFDDNAANQGGAVYLANASGARFTRCSFDGNDEVGIVGDGGAIAVATLIASFEVLIEDCSFTNNHSNTGGAIDIQGGGQGLVKLQVDRSHFEGNTAIHGGAVEARGTTLGLTFSDCTFVQNSVSNVGAAVALFNANALFARCSFLGNSTPWRGGAVAAGDSGTLGTGSSVAMVDCLVVGNSAQLGGALSNFGGGSSLLSGCTFMNNTASQSGGVIHNQEASAIFGTFSPTVNLDACILFGNTDQGGADETAQIHTEEGTVFVDHCDIQGLTGLLGGVGNIDADPLLVDLDGPDNILGTLDDDARLSAGSPCIDAADKSALLADVADVDCDGDTLEPQPLDLAGLVRVVDDPATPDSGPGAGPMLDMGAHEFGSTLPGDLWTDLGGGTPGILGTPQLELLGSLCPGQAVSLSVSAAAPSSLLLLWISVASTPASFVGGTLHAFPAALKVILPTSPTGTFDAQLLWAAGVPSSSSFWWQGIVLDGSVGSGLTLTNGVLGVTP